MQRADQRDDRAQQGPRGRRARRLSRALVCAAAVPAVLITAACSSDSDDAKDQGGKGASAQQTSGASGRPSASASPTVQAAKYRKLPDACAVVTKKTLSDLAPKAKSGKKGGSDDPSSRASCAWSSLDNNGVKGSQFRWLNVSLLRFDSDTARGSGEAQAHTYYGGQVKDGQSVDGAKAVKVVPLSGTGDEASAVRYDLKKKEGLFKQQTLVARVENVVVTVDYNGAGLAGEKTPDADGLTKDAQRALKDAVAAVSSANGAGSPSSSPSPSSSASSSAPSSKGASASPSKKASPSKSAAKKD